MTEPRPGSPPSASTAAGPLGNAPDMAARLVRIVEAFRAADVGMRGLPVHNPALSVEAVGFRAWSNGWLGVMITPWFMNLMLIPADAEAWAHLRAGDKVVWAFPAGRIEFIVGAGEGSDCYQCCSLFSPVFEFADQETARTSARAALAALMNPNLGDGVHGSATGAPAATGPVGRRRLLRGDLRDQRRS